MNRLDWVHARKPTITNRGANAPRKALSIVSLVCPPTMSRGSGDLTSIPNTCRRISQSSRRRGGGAGNGGGGGGDGTSRRRTEKDVCTERPSPRLAVERWVAPRAGPDDETTCRSEWGGPRPCEAREATARSKAPTGVLAQRQASRPRPLARVGMRTRQHGGPATATWHLGRSATSCARRLWHGQWR